MEIPLANIENPLVKMSVLIWHELAPIIHTCQSRVMSGERGANCTGRESDSVMKKCGIIWDVWLSTMTTGRGLRAPEFITDIGSSLMVGSCNGSFLWKLLSHWHPTGKLSIIFGDMCQLDMESVQGLQRRPWHGLSIWLGVGIVVAVCQSSFWTHSVSEMTKLWFLWPTPSSEEFSIWLCFVWVFEHVQHMCGQKTNGGAWSSLSTMRVPGMGLKSSLLGETALAQWVISPALARTLKHNIQHSKLSFFWRIMGKIPSLALFFFWKCTHLHMCWHT